jgi:hypothetical protein
MDTEGGYEDKFMHANEGKSRFESVDALIDRRTKLEAIMATVFEYGSAEKGK